MKYALLAAALVVGSIALALVAGGRSRIGRRLHVTTPAGFTTVKVCEPVFWDPKGERINA